MQHAQLTGIRFERFKAFAEEVAIDFAPLTLIAGVNSGGKSTILQTLLLARQTLLTPYRSTTEDALVYRAAGVATAGYGAGDKDRAAGPEL